jgi:hypothetical protein
LTIGIVINKIKMSRSAASKIMRPDLLSVGLWIVGRWITNATLTDDPMPGLQARPLHHSRPSRMIYLRVGTEKILYPRRKFGPTARQGCIVAPLGL